MEPSAVDFSSLGLTRPTPSATANKDLGQEDFLNLMTTQLQNQDPFKPMESAEFLSQIAQFSTVNGITELQQSFAGLADSLHSNQALQASSLVGREALVTSGTGLLQRGGSLEGAVDLNQTTRDVTIEITDPSGRLIRNIELGTQVPGVNHFTWDGLDSDGARVPPGAYQIRASGQVGGVTQALETLVQGHVNSVTLNGPNGLILNVDGYGAVDFGEVRQLA